MTRSGSRSLNDERLRRAYLPRRRSACQMRKALRAYLGERSLDPCAVNDVVLAADEAFVNAMVHADGREGDGVIIVSAWVEDGVASVVVRDIGPGFDAGALTRDAPPGHDEPHGRGLFLIRSVMDKVRITSGRMGTTVRMSRRIA
jgi:anti-sigma regulatory factor (Ser/Thr protein kinase)